MSLQAVREQLENSPWRLLQIVVVALCVAINMLDGFDILALTLISPTLTRQWHLAPSTLGFLFSAGLVGTAVGGFALSPIADLWGRRTAIMINLVLMSVGMMLSATAGSVVMLAALRFCTGLGVGAMAGCVGTLAFEYCPRKARALGLGLVVIGYTVGTLLGGYVALPLLAHFSWHGIFVFGGLCSLVLLALVYLLLPESLDILAGRQGPKALAAINRVLARLDEAALSELPAPVSKEGTGSLLDLLRSPILARTTLMGLSYLLFMMSEYFFLNWNNQLTTNAGFSDADGIFITRLTSLGGLAGGVVVGLLAVRLPIRAVGSVALLAIGIGLVAFGAAATNLPLAQAAAAVVGFGIFGAAVALYATGAATFPARVRATGMGVVMSAGRIGSFLGPGAAGLLLAAPLNRFTVCAILAVPVVFAIAALVKVPLTPVEASGSKGLEYAVRSSP